MNSIDSTNRRILNILQEQGAITNAELAARIGLSPATVFERVKKLEKSGILRRYVGLVDLEKVGKSIIAFVFLTLNEYTSEAIEYLSEEVRKMPEVLECYRISGEKDYLLKVVADDIPTYDRFVFHKLGRLSHVGKFTTMFALSTVKYQTKVSLADE